MYVIRRTFVRKVFIWLDKSSHTVTFLYVAFFMNPYGYFFFNAHVSLLLLYFIFQNTLHPPLPSPSPPPMQTCVISKPFLHPPSRGRFYTATHIYSVSPLNNAWSISRLDGPLTTWVSRPTSQRHVHHSEGPLSCPDSLLGCRTELSGTGERRYTVAIPYRHPNYT